MKKIIRLTESDVHRIVKNSVKRIINEIGDTPKGQAALGALMLRKYYNTDEGDTYDNWIDNKHKTAQSIYDYAENARGGDEYNKFGDNTNPNYKYFSQGHRDYFNSHPEEFNRYQCGQKYKKK